MHADLTEASRFTELASPDRPLAGELKLHTGGLDSVMNHIIAPIYLSFFERYNEWLTANYGDGVNWPPTLNFARVIRNAAAHGMINIRNPGAPSVTWRGFTIGPADSGRRVIGADMKTGEILGLMFDLNDELDRLDVPVL